MHMNGIGCGVIGVQTSLSIINHGTLSLGIQI
jgi:hypothetical protein